MQIAQDISSRLNYFVIVKKRRRSGLRRGFLTCTIGEIDKSRCVTYFSTVPKFLRRLHHLFSYSSLWDETANPHAINDTGIM